MESPLPPNPTVRPMNEPHTPISENEMNPGTSYTSSGRNTFITLASMLVLAGIVGITLFFYIQNKNQKSYQPVNSINDKLTNSDLGIVKEVNGTKVVGAQNQHLVEKYGTICKKFNSLESALNFTEVACELDISSQNLTTLPDNISRLSNLTEINLSNNHFTEFPKQLLTLKNLVYINLSSNRLENIPDEIINSLPKLQKIQLENNLMSEEDVERYLLIPTRSLPKNITGIPEGQP